MRQFLTHKDNPTPTTLHPESPELIPRSRGPWHARLWRVLGWEAGEAEWVTGVPGKPGFGLLGWLWDLLR